jgi:hypothetical protein
MVYGYGCVVVGKPSHFTTSTKMRFFYLPLSTMNYKREPLEMEEALCLLWIFWFIILDLCGGNDVIELCIDNLLPPFIPLVGFYFRVGASI